MKVTHLSDACLYLCILKSTGSGNQYKCTIFIEFLELSITDGNMEYMSESIDFSNNRHY